MGDSAKDFASAFAGLQITQRTDVTNDKLAVLPIFSGVAPDDDLLAWHEKLHEEGHRFPNGPGRPRTNSADGARRAREKPVSDSRPGRASRPPKSRCLLQQHFGLTAEEALERFQTFRFLPGDVVLTFNFRLNRLLRVAFPPKDPDHPDQVGYDLQQIEQQKLVHFVRCLPVELAIAVQRTEPKTHAEALTAAIKEEKLTRQKKKRGAPTLDDSSQRCLATSSREEGRIPGTPYPRQNLCPSVPHRLLTARHESGPAIENVERNPRRPFPFTPWSRPILRSKSQRQPLPIPFSPRFAAQLR
ncbi:hypothetical protein L596_006383 [Steinernema carpocapsae]|uniref:Uncharacterized protein n=1 Tax=Steinernema carpocapsae TaxID=34508 RepID=A0A4U8V1X0_STECR|nr:hypothetical protein L596_006383 [Steinernema carpocapsae]